MKIPSITLLCTVIVAIYGALLANAAAQGHWLYDSQGHPISFDYISMWAAGHAALSGVPADAYDLEMARQAQSLALGHPPTKDYPWAYPPPYIALVAALALLPYIPSMLLFIALTLAGYAYVNAKIVGKPEGAIWMLATAATFYNLGVGPNGFLSAALLGAGLLLGPTRPLIAGVLIGLLAFKPQLGLLVPVALLATGNWRMILSAGTTITAMSLAAFLGMGIEPFKAFVAAITSFGGLVMSDAYPMAFKLQSPYGVANVLGLAPAAALKVQYACTLATVCVVFLLWRSRVAYDLKCAGLIIAATLSSPYLFTYDLTLLTVATAFLIRHGLQQGFSVLDSVAIVGANVLIAIFPFAAFPTGPFAALLLAAAVAAHAAAGDESAGSRWSRWLLRLTDHWKAQSTPGRAA